MAPRHTTAWLLISTAISAAGCVHHYHFEPTTRQAEYFDPSTWFLDGVSAEAIAGEVQSSSDPKSIVTGLGKIADIANQKTASRERTITRAVNRDRNASHGFLAGVGH